MIYGIISYLYCHYKECKKQLENSLLMEFRKSKKADLENKRSHMLRNGMFGSLAIVLCAFTSTEKVLKGNSPLPINVLEVNEEMKIGDDIFVIVENMPEFPGGELAMRKFLNKAIRYPAVAQENGIQGKVIVNFVIDKDGSVSNARIARGVYPSIDKEALRVVMSLPKWKPGMQRGKAVRVSYTVPISFQLL